jgi:hypothetical protein
MPCSLYVRPTAACDDVADVTLTNFILCCKRTCPLAIFTAFPDFMYRRFCKLGVVSCFAATVLFWVQMVRIGGTRFVQNVVAPFYHSILTILFRRTQKVVERIAAWWIVTMMTNVQCGRVYFVMKKIRNAWNLKQFVINPYATISVFIPRPYPRPAFFVTTDIDFCKKSFDLFCRQFWNWITICFGQVSLLRRLMSQMASAEFAFGVDLL